MYPLSLFRDSIPASIIAYSDISKEYELSETPFLNS